MMPFYSRQSYLLISQSQSSVIGATACASSAFRNSPASTKNSDSSQDRVTFSFQMPLLRPLLLLLAVLAAIPLPGASPQSSRPSVILITIDTTRADRMGFLGSTQGLTPQLDALARQSIIFKAAYAHVPLTTPSHATILTGTYPQFNHERDMGDPLATDLPYLPEILRHQGYVTAAFVGGSVLDPAAGSAVGFNRGFDTYDAGFHKRRAGEDRYHSVERRAEVVVAHAIEWL